MDMTVLPLLLFRLSGRMGLMLLMGRGRGRAGMEQSNGSMTADAAAAAACSPPCMGTDRARFNGLPYVFMMAGWMRLVGQGDS